MSTDEINDSFQCPCCGHQTIGELGGYEICDVCNWEDDPVQSEHPDLAGGANELSLHLARIHWQSGRPVK